jgi:predicted metal-dependent hydrolase
MNEHLIKKAFKELYPDKEFTYRPILKYSGKFSGFNGNIRFGFNKIDIRMSKQLKKVSEEIRIGLIQTLLVKVIRPKAMKKVKTTNMDLYNSFLKNVHIALPKEVESSLLLQKFIKINEQFFNGLLDQPSLKWGTYSKSKLGQYEYGTDQISISKHLEHAPDALLEYVLYHEMLHKKHKFTSKNGRSHYHTKAFREDEKKFPNAMQLEKEIPQYLRWKRKPRTLRNNKKPSMFQSFLDRFT